METASYLPKLNYNPEVIVVDHIPYMKDSLRITCLEDLNKWTCEKNLIIVDKYGWSHYIIEEFRHGIAPKVFRGFIPFFVQPDTIYLRDWNLTPEVAEGNTDLG